MPYIGCTSHWNALRPYCLMLLRYPYHPLPSWTCSISFISGQQPAHWLHDLPLVTHSCSIHAGSSEAVQAVAGMPQQHVMYWLIRQLGMWFLPGLSWDMPQCSRDLKPGESSALCTAAYPQLCVQAGCSWCRWKGDVELWGRPLLVGSAAWLAGLGRISVSFYFSPSA